MPRGGYKSRRCVALPDPRHWDNQGMTRAVEELNRRMLRARDAIDRAYAQPLDIPALAAVASVSEAHFIRTFKSTFGETPHRYLQRRRVERAMHKLTETERSVTDICLEVGFTSLGTFSRTFSEIVGDTPSGYRENSEIKWAPTCFTMAWTRPSGGIRIPPRNPRLNSTLSGGAWLEHEGRPE
jgi:AraC-like DNA-binding protein